jgi:hypothetical protein
MELITKQQIKDIYWYVKLLEKDTNDIRTEAWVFSNNRTSTVLNLSNDEAVKYIDFLRQCEVKTNEACDRMRKKIISRFHEMGYRKNGRIQMDRVNRTIEKYGYLHKPLNKYTYKELPKLVSQFSTIKADYLERMK